MDLTHTVASADEVSSAKGNFWVDFMYGKGHQLYEVIRLSFCQDIVVPASAIDALASLL